MNTSRIGDADLKTVGTAHARGLSKKAPTKPKEHAVVGESRFSFDDAAHLLGLSPCVLRRLIPTGKGAM